MAGVTSAVDLGGTLKESLSVRDRIREGRDPGAAHVGERAVDHAGPRRLPVALPNQLLVDTPARGGEGRRRTRRRRESTSSRRTSGSRRRTTRRSSRRPTNTSSRSTPTSTCPPTCATRFEAGVDVLQHVGSAGMPTYDAGSSSGDRREGHAGRRHRGAPGVPLSGDRRLPGATPGPAARRRLRAGDLGRGPGVARAAGSALSYFSATDQRDALREGVARGSGSSRARSWGWAPTPARR